MIGPLLAASSGSGGIVALVYVVVIIFEIAALWKVFTKAGEAGWLAIIPIVSTIFVLKIGGRPMWWVILLFIPIVNIVFFIIMMTSLSKSFGNGGGFAVGLILLGFVFIPILGFGSARYVGQGARPAA